MVARTGPDSQVCLPVPALAHVSTPAPVYYAHSSKIGTRIGLAPALTPPTSVPHDLAQPCHICAGTGRSRATSARGMDPPLLQHCATIEDLESQIEIHKAMIAEQQRVVRKFPETSAVAQRGLPPATAFSVATSPVKSAHIRERFATSCRDSLKLDHVLVRTRCRL